MDLTLASVMISRVDTRIDEIEHQRYQDQTNSTIEEAMLQYMRAKGGLKQVVQNDELLRDVLSFVKQRLSEDVDGQVPELDNAISPTGAEVKNDALSDNSGTLEDNKEVFLRKFTAVKAQIQAQDEEGWSNKSQSMGQKAEPQTDSQVCTYHEMSTKVDDSNVGSLKLSSHRYFDPPRLPGGISSHRHVSIASS